MTGVMVLDTLLSCLSAVLIAGGEGGQQASCTLVDAYDAELMTGLSTRHPQRWSLSSRGAGGGGNLVTFQKMLVDAHDAEFMCEVIVLDTH